ncbi:MAG: nitronate monooxygenase [Thermoplasmata archaeon]
MPECVTTAAGHVRVVDFFYGDPDPALVDRAHRGGALASWQVGSVGEAEAAAAAGCDLIVAQGIEGGGHLRGRTGLLSLLSEVLDRVHVPVIAAGGIGDGRAMAAALAAGAAGVRVGTRFLGAAESAAHPEYVQALIRADARDTVYTDKFAIGWPHAPHRVLRSCLEAVEAFDGDVVGEFVEPNAPPTPIRRFQGNFTPFVDDLRGRIEAMPLWAGESVGAIKRVQPAAEIVQELSAEAEELLGRWPKAGRST